MKLTEQDSTLFYEILFSLLDYTNCKYTIFDNIDIQELIETYQEIPPQVAKDICDYIWDNIEIIDEFISDVELLNEHKELLLSWKRRVRGRFILERHLKKGSILINVDTKDVYLVCGIISTWEEMLPPFTPIMIEATLLPFKDKIISDGLVSSYPIRFGRGAKEAFKYEYMKAKNNNTIIKEL